MDAYTKPAHWSDPRNKLFPHQVGFTCPPYDWDAAPADFLRMAPDSVGVHGRMLHVPDYVHRLDQRKKNFDLLTALDGVVPPVLDSDDLLEDPHKMTKTFCDAVGIPFVEESLSWEVGGDPSVHSWWDGGSFHANLAKSTGLAPQPRRYVDLEDTPERVRRVHRRMQPHYQHLFTHRLGQAR
jgi:hypothetical protein